MSWCVMFAMLIGLGLAVKGSHLLWYTTAIMGLYLVGKKYMSGNRYAVERPFQSMALLLVGWFLVQLTFEKWAIFGLELQSVFGYRIWNFEEYTFFFIITALMGGLYMLVFSGTFKVKGLNPFIFYLPAFVYVLLLMSSNLDEGWFYTLASNALALSFGVYAMIQGSKNNSAGLSLIGFLLICTLLWIRYFDMDIGFIFKGLMFLGIGGTFFLLNFFLKDKVDDIELYKNLDDEA